MPVWEDNNSIDLNAIPDDEREKRVRWDDRLYGQDVRHEKLACKCNVVARYLDAVGDVLFGGRKRQLVGGDEEGQQLNFTYLRGELPLFRFNVF